MAKCIVALVVLISIFIKKKKSPAATRNTNDGQIIKVYKTSINIGKDNKNICVLVKWKAVNRQSDYISHQETLNCKNVLGEMKFVIKEDHTKLQNKHDLY